jgi:hypothetical protein
MQATEAGPRTGGSVRQPVRKRAVVAGLVQCCSRLRQVWEREAAAGAGAIWSAAWWGRSGRCRMWMNSREGERRKREGSAPRPRVWRCEGANMRGKRCDFFPFYTIQIYPWPNNEWDPMSADKEVQSKVPNNSPSRPNGRTRPSKMRIQRL